MSYETTLAWLYGLDARLGMDFRLARLTPVLDALDHPERAFPSIHIAGTNGKGSTAAMLHAAYTAAGARVGLYTSPHLLSFRERIRVGADLIDEQAVVSHGARVRDAMARVDVELTFFEIATIMAFLEFRRREVELAVVETGLGGRLDATNVVRSVAAAITSIGYDHQVYLGDSIERIAGEKAGILREDVPLVTGDVPPAALAVIEAARAGHRSPWLRYGRDFGPWEGDGAGATVGLRGAHQRINMGVAAAVTRVLEPRFALAAGAFETGLASARWPGRFEDLGGAPSIVVDGAHNPQAAATVVAELRRCSSGDAAARGRDVLVFGAMADKDWGEMLSVLSSAFDEIVLVPVDVPRSFDPAAAAEALAGARSCHLARTAADGLAHARELAGPSGRVVVTGSIFLVAELYVSCGGDEEPFESHLR